MRQPKLQWRKEQVGAIFQWVARAGGLTLYMCEGMPNKWTVGVNWRGEATEGLAAILEAEDAALEYLQHYVAVLEWADVAEVRQGC